MKKIIKSKFVSYEKLGWIIYLFLTLYTALNISSERFGSPDDLSITTMQTSPQGLIKLAIEAAESQGRIQQILFYTLDNLGLNEKYSITTPLIKFLSVVFICTLFSYLVKILYSEKISLFASLFFISTVATTGEYNALTSFPLWFTAGIISFLLSIILFIKQANKGNNLILVFFAITSLFALLSSEVFFLLFATYPILQFKISGRSQFKYLLKKLRNTYIVLFTIYITYLLTYISFKFSTKGTYEGASISFANPFKSLVSSTALSLGQLNIYALKRQVIENQFEFNLIIFTGFIIFALILNLLLMRTNHDRLKTSNIEISLLIALALLGNLILGFTFKYSKIGLIYPLYLNSLISYLFISLAVTLMAFKFFGGIKLRTVLILSLFLFGFTSFSDQSVTYKQIRTNQKVFRVAECMTENSELISKFNTQILSSDMQKLSKSYSYNYFGEKFRLITGKNFQFFQNLNSVDQNYPFTEIQVVLQSNYAVGRIENIVRSKSVEVINYRVSYKDCNFKIDYLTPSTSS